MSEQSDIQWCDSTWNPWSGCTKISDGCRFCYAEARDKRMMQEKILHWGKGAPRLKHSGAVKAALAMNRKPWICEATGEAVVAGDDCTKCGSNLSDGKHHRRRIFSLSLGDWLDDEVPVEWLAEMLDTIRQCDQVIWILCTKRPENWRGRIDSVIEWLSAQNPGDGPFPKNAVAFEVWLVAWQNGEFPQNICLLTSVENQEQADKRIPELLKIPARWRGLSCEPLLGPVDLSRNWITTHTWHNCLTGATGMGRSLDKESGVVRAETGLKIDWLIIGGESGPSARPCDVAWIRSLVRQGQAAAVATFVKQLGAMPVIDDVVIYCWGKKVTLTTNPSCTDKALINLADKKGGNPAEWSQDLRVQQWPKGF